MLPEVRNVVNTASDVNYFICTLGQAAEYNNTRLKTYGTVNDFFDEQCQSVPNRPAVGFPVPSETGQPWKFQVYTFRALHQRSVHLARNVYSKTYRTRQTVALLCQSSADFLLHWLGLMRAGHSVLLIAPQCQPSAIAHLCKECHVSSLIYDEAYHKLAPETKQLLPSLVTSVVQSTEDRVETQLGTDEHVNCCPVDPPVVENDIAYLHHTSGTSSGLPKPIPQSHRAAAGVLPRLQGEQAATFSTTPLYHGGVADCFRSWTSGAMIWLFPGKDVPITATNVMRSLKAADESSTTFKTPRVKYFSSVPYVLQMVAADEEGLARLQNMDLVGVGGAALPPAVGDDLVSKDINLVSRFGSSECGFLMSSHREYSKNKEWQYLRSHGSPLLKFERQDDGLSELVIQPQWPHMAKRNRDDGSYATADLFEAHPTIPNAWRYHSRADSQLTLITGKKFDPTPLEDAIAACPEVRDCLIFGKGRQCPGALLFREVNSPGMGDVEYLDQVWPLVQKLNEEGQNHTRIPRSMMFAMPTSEPPLEKSSKGTVLRRQAEERYESIIEMAYQNQRTQNRSSVPDHDLPLAVLEIIKTVVEPKDVIPDDGDLFAHGVDSVACMQIRASLQSLLPTEAAPLPLNVVYDCGSIQAISKYIKDIRHGRTTAQEDETHLMRDLAKKYGSFPKTTDPPKNKPVVNGEAPNASIAASPSSEEVIILTGATGALGAHLLDQLRSHPSAPHIVCLVRASSPHAAHERVNKSLTQRLKPGLPPFSPSSPDSPSTNPPSPSPNTISTPLITCLPTTLSSPTLGLSPSTYASLAANTTTIIHAAWAVNFTTRLRSFEKDHIAGLSHLLALALSSPRAVPPKFIFCSSTASVTSSPSPIPETISHDPKTASPLGYSRSKWVAEQICAAAHDDTRLKNRISVLRIGQLCGDEVNGVWNKSEAWPLMLSAGQQLKALPRLDGKLDWLAVDLAAKAVLEVADTMNANEEREVAPVYHILNPDRTRTWSDLLQWTQKIDPSLTTLSPKDWIARLEALRGGHPAKKLIGLWKEAYGQDEVERRETENEKGNEEGVKKEVVFEIENAKVSSRTMREVEPVNAEGFARMWKWIGGNVGVEVGLEGGGKDEGGEKVEKEEKV